MCRTHLEPDRMVWTAAFRRTVRHVFGIVLLAGLSGCGTMQNLDGRRYMLISIPGEVKPRVYGGVLNDLDVIIPDKPADWRKYADPFSLPVLAFFAVDVPVCAVADTITIPTVLHRRRTRTYAPVTRREEATKHALNDSAQFENRQPTRAEPANGDGVYPSTGIEAVP